MKPGLVEMSAKLKKKLLEELKLIKASKAKNPRSLASQFGIAVGAVNNILKRKREYENLGDPLGWTPLYSERSVGSRDCSL